MHILDSRAKELISFRKIIHFKTLCELLFNLSFSVCSNCEQALAIADINQDITRFLCASKDCFTILQHSTYLTVSGYPLLSDLLRGEPYSLPRVYHTTSLSESPLDSIEAVIVGFLDSTRERIYKRERENERRRTRRRETACQQATACRQGRPCINERLHDNERPLVNKRRVQTRAGSTRACGS